MKKSGFAKFCAAVSSTKKQTITVYSYKKARTIVNAHASQISCASAFRKKFFITGASKEFKVWNEYSCLAQAQNLHQSAIISIKIIDSLQSIDSRDLSFLIVTGGKDRQLKFSVFKEAKNEEIEENKNGEEVKNGELELPVLRPRRSDNPLMMAQRGTNSAGGVAP